MTFTHRARALKLLLSMAFLCALQGSVAAMQISEVAGRSVTMTLVKADNPSPAPWPAEEIKLVSETITTKAEDDIFSLLEANGIHSDNEAFTLVYDLNPTLEQADPLPAGISLTLPKVSGGAQLREKLKSGYIVMLTVDKDIKEQFGRHVKDISDLSAKFSSLEPERFTDVSKRKETIESVREMSGWLEHMRGTFVHRTARPLRRITLIQLNDEAKLLNAVLEQALRPGQKLTAEGQAQISAVHAVIKQENEKWDQKMAGEAPPSDTHFNIVVEIKGGDPGRVQTLRVYYVFAGRIQNPPVPTSNFTGLGQGSSAWLPTKDYKVWAARDGDPSRPVTPITHLPVRRPVSGKVIKLDLSLNQ